MTNCLRLERRILAEPDIETFNLIKDEWHSLSRSAPNIGDFMVFGKERLIQNCRENGIPKRHPPVLE
jgi:hypothetical protein